MEGKAVLSETEAGAAVLSSPQTLAQMPAKPGAGSSSAAKCHTSKVAHSHWEESVRMQS